ncbi:hypothetical protein MMC22_004393 [Lobaria immixta]|nr:hypothetical protein [Lobaria immixta]
MAPGTPDAERILRIVREAFEELQASQPENDPEASLRQDAALYGACVCLLRFHNPEWSDDYIAQHLRNSFSETRIHARHIDIMFLTVCQGRPEWARDLRQVNDSLLGGEYEEHEIRATITRRARFSVSPGLQS